MVTDSLPSLVLFGIRVDNLVSESAQGHVRPLRDIEQLTAVWLEEPSSEQWPQLQTVD